jgi:hypothetical protein
MTELDEEVLGTVLRQVAPEPSRSPDRAGAARRRARLMRRRRRALVAGAAVVVALAVVVPSTLLDNTARRPAGPAAATPTVCADRSCDVRTVLGAITRPLRLPSASPTSCPVSPTRRLPAGAGFTRAFVARGRPPFYVAGSAPLSLAPARRTGDGQRWRDQKVIWVVDGSYAGPLLVRGGRIDRPGPLRLLRYIGAHGYTGGAGDDRPAASLLYDWSGPDATPDGSTSSFPSGIYVKAPGCYAVQVDGVGFSEHLVFRVTGR